MVRLLCNAALASDATECLLPLPQQRHPPAGVHVPYGDGQGLQRAHQHHQLPGTGCDGVEPGSPRNSAMPRVDGQGILLHLLQLQPGRLLVLGWSWARLRPGDLGQRGRSTSCSPTPSPAWPSRRSLPFLPHPDLPSPPTRRLELPRRRWVIHRLRQQHTVPVAGLPTPSPWAAGTVRATGHRRRCSR